MRSVLTLINPNDFELLASNRPLEHFCETFLVPEDEVQAYCQENFGKDYTSYRSTISNGKVRRFTPEERKRCKVLTSLVHRTEKSDFHKMTDEEVIYLLGQCTLSQFSQIISMEYTLLWRNILRRFGMTPNELRIKHHGHTDKHDVETPVNVEAGRSANQI